MCFTTGRYGCAGDDCGRAGARAGPIMIRVPFHPTLSTQSYITRSYCCGDSTVKQFIYCAFCKEAVSQEMFGAFHAHVDEENEVHSCPHATISPTFRALKARKQSSSLNEGAVFGEDTKKFDAVNDQSHPSKKVVAAAATANLKDLVQAESVPSTEDTTSQYFHFQYNLALMTKNYEEAVFRNDNDKRKADVMDDQPLPSKKVAAVNLYDLVQNFAYPAAVPSSAMAQPPPSNFDMEMKAFLDELDLLSTAAAAGESGGEDPPADDEMEEAFVEVVGYEQCPFLGFGQLPRQEEGAIHCENFDMAND
ncbi:predicted protein [Thalassiosira pseudonana CCMP1335]|uniref:Uncharacterized protein n=1 Tax=Thalassiosira pseudonana TaxID=35128 RepID=B8CA82_THAPS|nr:predicted protein [Thalassiosira pseudonana CCMP1335]EED89461.1 predicted protein [Thalassiosira pseudonana CCMP1335]